MHKQVRGNMWETNSSSSHAVVLFSDSDPGVYDTYLPHEDGVVVLSGGEYGWGYDTLSTTLDKLNYAATEVFCYGDENRQEELRTIVREVTGLEIEFQGSHNDNAYIDHQSVGTLREYSEEVPLKELIFNSNYGILIDNDNH